MEKLKENDYICGNDTEQGLSKYRLATFNTSKWFWKGNFDKKEKEGFQKTEKTKKSNWPGQTFSEWKWNKKRCEKHDRNTE